jgi:hypothetical protein
MTTENHPPAAQTTETQSLVGNENTAVTRLRAFNEITHRASVLRTACRCRHDARHQAVDPILDRKNADRETKPTGARTKTNNMNFNPNLKDKIQ